MISNRNSAIFFYLRSSALICGLVVLTGCVPKRGVETNRPRPYYGETLPMAAVVERINANNSKLPTLRAHIEDFEAVYFDEEKHRHEEVFSGTLLYRAPRDALITGSKGPAFRVLEIGSNQDIYWVVARSPGPDTAWWGRYKFLGAKCAEAPPIRPDLVVEVLGVSTINPDFNQLPVPIMRFNHAADAYMLIWSKRSENNDRWVAIKEVWYDRATLLPRAVVLFDENGRVTLEATLSKHLAVETPNIPREQWPKVASEYRLYFPPSQSRLLMRLTDTVLKYKGLPNDATFRFNPGSVDVSKVIQLDEACGP
jgi:hypothetical protein